MTITRMGNPMSSHVLHVFLVLVFGVHFSFAAVPAVFIFGDSTVDVGTNNYLNRSKARADFPYNGIDYYNSAPTGRFSNGLNAADQIPILLGFQGSPPSYLSLVNEPSTVKQSILQGVNFASGGSGILDGTGTRPYNEVISMGEQIQQFALVKGNITEAMCSNASDTHISQSLFFISAGSNDLFDHYDYNRTTISKEELMATLNSTYNSHLRNLYNMGARKFGIVSAPAIGCCPHARLLNKTQDGWGCSDELNDYAQSFYGMIASLLQGLSSELTGMKYSLGDAYKMTTLAIEAPNLFGFKYVDAACCGSGDLNASKPCSAQDNAYLCFYRSNYLFWDMFHPTENASQIAALTFYGGDTTFVVPMNISQLAEASA